MEDAHMPVEAEQPTTPESPKGVLFLWTHSCAGSQMAETITRNVCGSMVEVFSAGTQPGEMHLLAQCGIHSICRRVRLKVLS